MLIFDGHLDLAMNALEWNRDLTRPIDEIRSREAKLSDKPDRGQGTVCFDEMRRGNIGLCVATQIARAVERTNPLPGWHSPEQAWAHTQGQLAWYRAMEEAGHLLQITTRAGLERHVKAWSGSSPGGPIGYILSLEGADSIVTLGHLERAYAQGLRAVGPAHYGPGTYAHGTDSEGGLGIRGRELLAEMDRLGIILDVTHLCDQSFWEALEHFRGPVWASHSNCRSLVPHHRQFSDEQLRALIGRGAVIASVLDAWMLVPGWIRGKSTPQGSDLTLGRLVDHMDHLCQLAGNASHCALGSDLDGGFGREQCPSDIQTIADMANLENLLAKRGYRPADIKAIAHENLVRFISNAWSAR